MAANTPVVKRVDDKKSDQKKAAPRPASKSAKPVSEKRPAKKLDAKQLADRKKRAEEIKKQQAELLKKRLAERKKIEEERERKLAEARKKAEEENKRREVERALARRRAAMPRIVQDLVDERQISQIESMQKRLSAALEAKYAEQKKIYQRGIELREEIGQIRERFEQDVEKVLNADQRKQVAKRKAEAEAQRRAYLAKREAARKAALKKREAEAKKN